MGYCVEGIRARDDVQPSRSFAALVVGSAGWGRDVKKCGNVVQVSLYELAAYVSARRADGYQAAFRRVCVRGVCVASWCVCVCGMGGRVRVVCACVVAVCV